jgi:predicted small lipoprotein YifL
LKNLLRSVVVATALVGTLAGCSGAAGLLAAAAAGAGTTPTTSTGTTPSAKPSATTSTGTPATTPTAKPTQAPSNTGVDPNSAAACTRAAATGTPSRGDSTVGDYNNQLLPDGWNAQFTSEEAVSNAIDNLYQNDWPCFQKFYPGASTVYKRKRGY